LLLRLLQRKTPEISQEADEKAQTGIPVRLEFLVQFDTDFSSSNLTNNTSKLQASPEVLSPDWVRHLDYKAKDC
jgi:hypothetical protein